MINRTQEEIMKSWNSDVNSNPLVSIRCTAYNHAPYIEQALDGFLMQKTDFAFEIIVHDDASTDNTAEIIKQYEIKYPQIIRPIYETENQFSKHDGTIHRLMTSLCRGKYYALCEGDDYWIDENKLQMQIDFLENNPEYGMCYTRARMYNQKKGEFLLNIWGEECTDLITMFKGYKIPTQTVVFRKELREQYIQEINPKSHHWLQGDLPLGLWFVINSKIKYFENITAVYRILENSAAHFTDFNRLLKYCESIYRIRLFYKEKYNLENISSEELKKQFENDIATRAFLMKEYTHFKEYNKNSNRSGIKKILFSLMSRSRLIFNIVYFIYTKFYK